MHSHRCLALLLASAVLYSAPVLAADTCNYPAGYICYDKLVFRPNGMGSWGGYSKGDGKASNGFAAKACAEGNFEGKSGWRLPTEKELLAFVSSDVRPRSEGNGWVLNGGATWTSTPAKRPGYFRYVSLRLDMLDNGQLPDFDARYVTCVREADIASGMDTPPKNDSTGSTSPGKGTPGSDKSPAPSSTGTEGKPNPTQKTKTGNAGSSSTAGKPSSYAPGSDNKPADQSAPSSKTSSKPAGKQDKGCWKAGPLSQVFVTSKPTADLCSNNCITVTVKNSAEGRIVANVCLHRKDGSPDDCGEIAVNPGESNSYGGAGSDYSVKYWGSNKPANDWVCKE